MQKLWLSLLDALLGWQHELAEVGSGGGPPGAGVHVRPDAAAAARSELRALLQELVRLVLARMGEQLPLDKVLAHRVAASSAWGCSLERMGLQCCPDTLVEADPPLCLRGCYHPTP